MTAPTFVILYVADPAASTAFYTDLLGRQPVDASANFAMYALDSGTMLGLWGRQGVKPETAAAPGGSEIAFPVENDATVDARHADWQGRGLPILQSPTTMEFGRTFTAADPDGHRLRVFAAPQG